MDPRALRNTGATTRGVENLNLDGNMPIAQAAARDELPRAALEAAADDASQQSVRDLLRAVADYVAADWQGRRETARRCTCASR